MKKLFLSAICLFILQINGFAQTPFSEFKVGYFNPKDAKAGYLFGVNLGRMIDESLSWSFELNYFQKTFRKETTVATEKDKLGQYKTKQLEVDMTSRIIPVFAKLNYEHPLGYKSPFYIRGSAGLGWEFVWNKEDNYETGEHKNPFFHGFGWQVSGGVGLEISSSANLFADVMYNQSTVKRNKEENELGYPTWQELNISGIGARVGVSIVGFGW